MENDLELFELPSSPDCSLTLTDVMTLISACVFVISNADESQDLSDVKVALGKLADATEGLVTFTETPLQ
jgi:hypothetical protein